MADAESLLMETSEQNGNEGEEDQNGAELEQEQELEQELDQELEQEPEQDQDLEQEQEQEQEQELMGTEDGTDNGTDGGKIDASKGEEDAGWVFFNLFMSPRE